MLLCCSRPADRGRERRRRTRTIIEVSPTLSFLSDRSLSVVFRCKSGYWLVDPQSKELRHAIHLLGKKGVHALCHCLHRIFRFQVLGCIGLAGGCFRPIRTAVHSLRVMRKIAVSAGRLNRSQLRLVVNIAFKRNTWRF